MQRAQPQGPTVWQKLKMGALMGTGVGLTIGFIFGSFSILRGGAGPRGALPTLSQYMLSSAATFGFFLAIGSVIRNDADLPAADWAASASQFHGSQIVFQSRHQGIAALKARWELEKRRKSED